MSPYRISSPPITYPTRVFLSTIAMVAVLFGTIWGCNKVAPVTADVGQVTICVEEAIAAQVAAGATTFEDIAVAIGAACGAITAQEVQNIIQLWTNGPSDDAGTLVFKSLKVVQAMQDPAFVVKLKALKHK
jgi:hypothetical protein